MGDDAICFSLVISTIDDTNHRTYHRVVETGKLQGLFFDTNSVHVDGYEVVVDVLFNGTDDAATLQQNSIRPSKRHENVRLMIQKVSQLCALLDQWKLDGISTTNQQSDYYVTVDFVLQRKKQSVRNLKRQLGKTVNVDGQRIRQVILGPNQLHRAIVWPHSRTYLDDLIHHASKRLTAPSSNISGFASLMKETINQNTEYEGMWLNRLPNYVQAVKNCQTSTVSYLPRRPTFDCKILSPKAIWLYVGDALAVMDKCQRLHGLSAKMWPDIGNRRFRKRPRGCSGNLSERAHNTGYSDDDDEGVSGITTVCFLYRVRVRHPSWLYI